MAVIWVRYELLTRVSATAVPESFDRLLTALTHKGAFWLPTVFTRVAQPLHAKPSVFGCVKHRVYLLDHEFLICERMPLSARRLVNVEASLGFEAPPAELALVLILRLRRLDFCNRRASQF